VTTYRPEPAGLDKLSITAKTLVTAAVGDHVLIADLSDSSNLKKVTVQTIVDIASAGNASTVTTNANLTGDVTSVGNATTLTNAPVIAKVLTGYTSGAGTVASTDSILQAIQKLNGNDATNANLTGHVTSVGNAAVLGSFTKAQLDAAVSDDNIAYVGQANTFVGNQAVTGGITASGQAIFRLSGGVSGTDEIQIVPVATSYIVGSQISSPNGALDVRQANGCYLHLGSSAGGGVVDVRDNLIALKQLSIGPQQVALTGTTPGIVNVAGGITASGAFTSTANGAASTPASILSGTWFTAGTGTTTKPQLLVEPTGTTSTGWNTAGTGIGINAASGFSGDFLAGQINGISLVRLRAFDSGNGQIIASTFSDPGDRMEFNCRASAAFLKINSTGAIYFSSASTAYSTPDIVISRNAANVLQIGTSTNNALGSLLLTNLTASGTAKLGIYTVATLPSASSNPYAEANVSDALTPAMGSTVASGGAVKTKVRSNGTDWTVAGI